ncbi:YceI family protein [Shimia ponticola]|uniref:YceI family protein n=1 Tax=Shimia ponticola TaxID=2582893 RepID=UPI0011BE754E|nr:YceI family protein [Shimia ponticola]
MHALLVLALFLCAPFAAFAQVVPYTLDRDRSTVVFTFDMAGTPTQGAMPISAADIRLNLGSIEDSSANVTMNAAAARTGQSFADEAMHGAGVLSTKEFPTMRFRTTGFEGDFNGGMVTGLLTLRGITQPVVMQANIYRQRGSADNDVSRLSVLLTGTVDRRVFGADGFPAIVSPHIKFEVLARIDRAE